MKTNTIIGVSKGVITARREQTTSQMLRKLEKLICQSCLFKLRHFAIQCLGSFQSKKRENEQVPAKKFPF